MSSHTDEQRRVEREVDARERADRMIRFWGKVLTLDREGKNCAEIAAALGVTDDQVQHARKIMRLTKPREE